MSSIYHVPHSNIYFEASISQQRLNTEEIEELLAEYADWIREELTQHRPNEPLPSPRDEYVTGQLSIEFVELTPRPTSSWYERLTYGIVQSTLRGIVDFSEDKLSHRYYSMDLTIWVQHSSMQSRKVAVASIKHLDPAIQTS